MLCRRCRSNRNCIYNCISFGQIDCTNFEFYIYYYLACLWSRQYPYDCSSHYFERKYLCGSQGTFIPNNVQRTSYSTYMCINGIYDNTNDNNDRLFRFSSIFGMVLFCFRFSIGDSLRSVYEKIFQFTFDLINFNNFAGK